MAKKSDNIEDEKTAKAQEVTTQPDGPGLRIGKRGEIIIFGKVLPGGGKLFRERVAQFQAEAPYWEGLVGTVHDFRAVLFDDDTRIVFMITYDGDFKAYLTDIVEKAHEWFDPFFPGVWEGYQNAHDPSTVDLVFTGAKTAELFYVAHPDVTVRDISKMKKLSKAFSKMLDAAS